MTPSQRVKPIKTGITGEQGTGKSGTAGLLSAALSIEHHNRAPVWVTDPELGWQFLENPIFKREKIELVQRRTPTFKAMIQDMRDAERAGACVWNVEIGKIWIELLKTAQKDCGDRWGMELNKMWTDFINEFLNSKLHCNVLGRVSDITEEVLNERDEIKRVKIGEGMKAGGQRNNFLYEPHLALRMTLERRPRKKRGVIIDIEGRMVHRAEVLKDRTWVLNGKIFRWTDLNGYKPGDYSAVWNSLKPHFLQVQAVDAQPTLNVQANSSDMIDNGRSEFFKQMSEKEIAIEKFDAFLGLLWPGQTAIEKKLRKLCEYNITGTLSRTEFETNTSVRVAKWAANVIAALAERCKGGGEIPANEKDLCAQIDMARQDVARAEKFGDEAFIAQQTLMQNKLEGSLAAARKGPEAFRQQTAQTAAEVGR